jgi:hypothetical protein
MAAESATGESSLIAPARTSEMNFMADWLELQPIRFLLF